MTSSEYIEQEVVERLRGLPSDKQQELLDFAEFLRQRAMASPARPHQSVRGLWVDLAVDVTEEDIDQARREMWATFPRDIA